MRHWETQLEEGTPFHSQSYLGWPYRATASGSLSNSFQLLILRKSYNLAAWSFELTTMYRPSPFGEVYVIPSVAPTRIPEGVEEERERRSHTFTYPSSEPETRMLVDDSSAKHTALTEASLASASNEQKRRVVGGISRLGRGV